METILVERLGRIGLRRLIQVGDRFYMELNNRRHRAHRVEVSPDAARRYYNALRKEGHGSQVDEERSPFAGLPPDQADVDL